MIRSSWETLNRTTWLQWATGALLTILVCGAVLASPLVCVSWLESLPEPILNFFTILHPDIEHFSSATVYSSLGMMLTTGLLCLRTFQCYLHVSPEYLGADGKRKYDETKRKIEELDENIRKAEEIATSPDEDAIAQAKASSEKDTYEGERAKEEEARQTALSGPVKWRKIHIILLWLTALAYSLVISTVYPAAIVLLTIVAIIAAVEHYSSVSHVEHTFDRFSDKAKVIEGLVASVDHSARQLGDQVKVVSQGVTSIRNAQGLDRWIGTIHNSYINLKENERVYAVIRWWDIDISWWKVIDDRFLNHTSMNSIASLWESYFTNAQLDDPSINKPTLYNALRRVPTARFRFIGIEPLSTSKTYYEEPGERSAHILRSGANFDAKKATKFRYLLGLAWNIYTAKIAKDRQFPDPKSLAQEMSSPSDDAGSGYIRFYVTRSAPWFHVSGKSVYELFPSEQFRDWAREVTKDVPQNEGPALTNEFKDWLATYAHRGRYAENYLWSEFVRASRVVSLDGGTGQILDRSGSSVDTKLDPELLFKVLQELGMQDWIDAVKSDMTSKLCPEGRHWGNDVAVAEMAARAASLAIFGALLYDTAISYPGRARFNLNQGLNLNELSKLLV